MVKAIVDISKKANRVINVVKAQFGLRDKSVAINKIVENYERFLMEPELRPEFIIKMQKIQKQKTRKIKDFAKEFSLKK